MAINFLGNTAFTQSGPPRYLPNGWDLDRLVVPMRGPATGLSAYLNNLVLWTPSSLNPNMFLADYASDEHKRYPTVLLTYIGKISSGVTPIFIPGIGFVLSSSAAPVKTDIGTSEQSAGYSAQDSGGSVNIDITYNTPHYVASWICRDRTMPPVADPPAVTYADVRFVKFKRTGSYSISGYLIDLFVQEVNVATDSQELVPGQYYRNTITKTISLQGPSS